MRTSLKYIIINNKLEKKSNNIDLDIDCYQLVQYCEKCHQFNLCIDRHDDNTPSANNIVPKYWMDLVAAVEHTFG